ncbi:MAG: hypothetical protein ACK4N5_26100, partial [Myxococcales bacterium]
WLAAAMHGAGAEQALLLRGPAVGYAVKGQDVGELVVGGVRAGNPPRIDADVQKLIDKGVPVFLVQEDAVARGITPADAVPRVEWIARSEVASLFVGAGRVFAW